MKKLLPFLLFIFFALNAFGQTPLQLVKKILPGGNGNAEKIASIDSTRFVVAGKTNGFAGATLVDQRGGVLGTRSFEFLGGIRSEFTDVKVAADGLVFAGDCDDCVPGFPGRQAFVVKTGFDLQNAEFRHVPIPAQAAGNEQFGFQRLVATNSGWVLASQLCIWTGSDTASSIQLTRLSDKLEIENNTFFDRYKFDNLSDIEYDNNLVYLLSWSVRYFAVNGDTTSLTLLDLDFNLVSERRYRCVGLTLCPEGNNTERWIIGGSKTDDFVNGPEAYLLYIDNNGEVLNSRTFGQAGKIDAVRDVQMLPNGNAIFTATYAQQPPPISWVFSNPDFLDYEEIGFPYSARVQRINLSTMQETMASTQLPNPQAEAVILRSVVPIAADGRYFVSVGYSNNRPLFFAETPTTSIKVGVKPNRDLFVDGEFGIERSDISETWQTAAKLYPNPVMAGQPVFVGHSGAALVRIYSATGQLVLDQPLAEGENRLNLPANLQAGMFKAVIATQTGIETVSFAVIR